MGLIFWQDQMPRPKQSHNDTSAESQTSQGRQPAWRGRWKAYVCSQAQFILLPNVGEVVSNTANLSQNSVPFLSGTHLWLFIRERVTLWWKVINRKIVIKGGKNYMSKDQMQNEIRYQLSKELLTRMLFRNLITEEEYNQMNSLNLQTFQPAEAKLYEKNSRCVTEKQVSFRVY